MRRGDDRSGNAGENETMLGPKRRLGGGEAWLRAHVPNSESGGAKGRCSKVITDKLEQGSQPVKSFSQIFLDGRKRRKLNDIAAANGIVIERGAELPYQPVHDPAVAVVDMLVECFASHERSRIDS